MKYILFFLIFFISSTGVWAKTEIQTSVSDTNIELGENLILSIDISGNEGVGSLQPNIAGLENFRIFSQSSGMSFQSINGQTQSSYKVTLELRPIKEGTFSLGPIELQGENEIFNDDTIYAIKVGEKSSVSSDTQNENIINGEKIQELPILKGIQKESSFPFITVIFGIFFLLFFLFLYFLLRDNKNKNSQHEDIQKDIGKKISPRETYFSELHDTLDSVTFAQIYTESFKKYINQEKGKDIQHMTLSEMQKNNIFLDPLIKKDYETLYFMLYNDNTEELDRNHKKEILDHLNHL